MPPLGDATNDLWPSDLTPESRGRRRAIARTLPESETQWPSASARRVSGFDCGGEAVDLHREPYFTNDKLGAALAARLSERPGRLVVVLPKHARVAGAKHHGRVSR